MVFLINRWFLYNFPPLMLTKKKVLIKNGSNRVAAITHAKNLNCIHEGRVVDKGN